MASGLRTGRFSRADRLLDARDFQRVLRRGRRRASPELVVVSMQRSLDRRLPEGDEDAVATTRARLGITTGRKAGNAVVRNRFRRRVRAWFRARREDLEPGVDLVIIARRPGTQLDYAELDARLSGLLGLSASGRAG
jgi:ribonuclease P protein component